MGSFIYLFIFGLLLLSSITLFFNIKSETNQAQMYSYLSLFLSHFNHMSLFSTLVLSLLISLFFANQFTTIEGSFIQNPNIMVKIINALKSKNQLIVHCKFGDDDLGVHKLTSWASYDFSFRPNLWGTTLFYCSFQWPSSFHYFDLYIDKRDRDNCESSLCSWHMSEENVCMFNYKPIIMIFATIGQVKNPYIHKFESLILILK